MAISAIPRSVRTHYEVHQWKHACAILKGDFPEQWQDIMDVLSGFRLRKRDVLAPGGGLSSISQHFNRGFKHKGWREKSFKIQLVVDSRVMNSPTHTVDCVKDKVALEIEWSNKDPFYDRDLNNFRLLFDLRAISVGVIITKSDELSDVFRGLGKRVWDKYGWSTTWMKKLLPRIEGGGGGGCPLIVFGITKELYVDE
jgi:hypothetical protein